MNELIAQALEKIKQNDFAEAVAFLKQASQSDSIDCAIFWVLIHGYMHDDRQDKLAYSFIFEDCLKRFIDEGGDKKFIVDLQVLNKMVACQRFIDQGGDKAFIPYLQTANEMYGWHIESFDVVEFVESVKDRILKLDLRENLPKDRLMINVALNRALMMLSVHAKKYEDSRVIFKRLAPFKGQLSWKELYAMGDCYGILSVQGKEQPRKEYLIQALALFEQGFCRNPSSSSEIRYLKQCLTLNLALKEWSKALDFLVIMASEQKGMEAFNEMYSALLNNPDACSYLKEHFFPRLKQENNPYLVIFWHRYIDRQLITIALLQIITLMTANDLNKEVDALYKLIDEILIAAPCLSMYLYKANRLSIKNESQQVMDTLSQATDPQSGVKKILKGQSFIAEITEMAPLAKQVDDLRKARAAAWQAEEKKNRIHRTNTHNMYTGS